MFLSVSIAYWPYLPKAEQNQFWTSSDLLGIPFYTGLDFLYKYLLYFFKLMIPLSFKSVVALVNIFKDKGLVLTSVECTGDGSNWNGWNGIDAVVEGFAVSI